MLELFLNRLDFLKDLLVIDEHSLLVKTIAYLLPQMPLQLLVTLNQAHLASPVWIQVDRLVFLVVDI